MVFSLLILALALGVGSALARRREAARRRRLNAALHELRRPLQALLLSGSARQAGAPEPIELALAALGDLDAAVNRRPIRSAEVRSIDAAAALSGAMRRNAAAARRRGVELVAGAAPRSGTLRADPIDLAAALDNLIANAIEHGSGDVEVEIDRRGGTTAFAITNPIGVERPGSNRQRLPRDADPRRRHGLAVTESVANRHDGELRLEAGEDRFRSTLRFPTGLSGRLR